MLASVLAVSNGLIIECDNSYYVKGCKISVVTIEDNEAITAVTGLVDAVPSDITDFWYVAGTNYPITSLPPNMATIFPQLTRYTWSWSNLKTLSPSDFASYPNLDHLDLVGNKIEILDAKLFVNNGKISWIDLSQNQIGQIGRGCFDVFTNANTFFLGRNTCSSPDDEFFPEKPVNPTFAGFMTAIYDKCPMKPVPKCWN